MCVKYIVDIFQEIITWCHGGITPIKYGALYNWYAATDVRGICASGWHLPTNLDYSTLYNFSAVDDMLAFKLCDTNSDYWYYINSNLTNELRLNIRGSGYRTGIFGGFLRFRESFYAWTPDESNPTTPYYWGIDGEDTNDKRFLSDEALETWATHGHSIRLVKNSTALSHGQTGTYTGNDGKVYRTICIGTQEWVADNLAETKYRDGSDIPIVTDNAAWAALVTGAMCYYNNDISNA